MSSRNLNVSVLVKLVDQMSGPLGRLQGALKALGAGLASSFRALGDVGKKIGIVGAAVAAFSFMQPIRAAAAFDAQLRDIAITAGLTGSAVEQFIGQTGNEWQKLALEVGQRSSMLAEGAQVLIAANMDKALIQRLMPTIGRVATAAGAELKDIAKTALALSQSLKVPAEQMELALAHLVTAGKLGRFELKDMAKEFPGLTAQMANLGVTGMEAVNFVGAALQIAMKGTDLPSQAATNLQNFLTKIAAPEAIKKFKSELGVDVLGVMTNAVTKGINPIEAVIQKLLVKLKPAQKEIDKIMREGKAQNLGDKEIQARIAQLVQGTKIGKLYADMQVLGFLMPMLQNIEEFKRMKKEIEGATTQVVDDDFASRMRGLSQQLERLGELGDQAMRRIGLAFGSNLPWITSFFETVLRGVDWVDQRFPGAIDKFLSISGAALAVGAAVAILTPVFSGLAAVFALIVSPAAAVVLWIGAIAAGAYAIYRNWDQVAAFFGRVWDGIRAAFETGLTALRDVGQRMAAAVIGGAFALGEAGAKLMQALWDGLKAKFEEMLAWVQAIPGRIAAAIGSIDLSNMIKMPQLPAWLGGGGPMPATPNGAPVDGGAPKSGGFKTGGLIGGSINVGGRIVVSASPGTSIQSVQSASPAVPVVPDRGAVVDRP